MSKGFSFRECFSEFIGSLVIIFFSGWAVVLQINEKIDFMTMTFVSSVSFGAFCWIGGSHSQCHFNPAITLACYAAKKVNSLTLTFYLISQFVGAYLGAVLIYYTIPEVLYLKSFEKDLEMGTPHVDPNIHWFFVFLFEIISAFIVMFIFCCMADQNMLPRYGILMGWGIGMSIVCFGAISNVSANPIRYLGPALLSLKLWDSFIYVVGPIVGALGSILLYENVFALSEGEREELKQGRTRVSQG